MAQDNANVYDDTTKLMMDEFGGIHVVGFGKNSLVATVARDAEMPWKRNHSLIVDLMIYRFNRDHRPDSTHPTQNNTGGDAAHTNIGAAWMREQVVQTVKSYETANLGSGVSKRLAPEAYWIAGQDRAAWQIMEAIRAIPLPTNADLLAEAMKLPRVAALVGAISDAIDANPTELNLGNYDHDDVCRLQNEAIDVWQILSAALAPFTAAKETP